MSKLKLQSVTINYGRRGTWYENARGKSFRVLGTKPPYGDDISEVLVHLDGYLDGEFGLHPTTALILEINDCICTYK